MSSSNTSTTPKHTFRRIITSHSPSDTDGNHVTLNDTSIPLRPVLDGQAHVNPFHAHLLPASNPHTLSSDEIDTTLREHASSGVVTRGGVNGQVTVLEPGFRVGMHRTNSVDYNVILEGSVWLITPDPTAQGGERKVLVNAGEVVVQRGTLHAWQAGDKGVRWVTVVVGVEKGVEVGGKELEEVDF